MSSQYTNEVSAVERIAALYPGVGANRLARAIEKGRAGYVNPDRGPVLVRFSKHVARTPGFSPPDVDDATLYNLIVSTGPATFYTTLSRIRRYRKRVAAARTLAASCQG